MSHIRREAENAFGFVGSRSALSSRFSPIQYYPPVYVYLSQNNSKTLQTILADPSNVIFALSFSVFEENYNRYYVK